MPLLKVSAAIAVIYFLISLFIASKVVEPIARHIDVSADFISKSYKEVTFTTDDHIRLKGWLLNPGTEKVIVFVPGILDNRTNGGYYGVLLSQELISRGYSVLVYDPRARGESEGKIRLKNENKDVEAAVSFLENSGFSSDKIGIIAYSSGGISVLNSLNKIGNIRAVILDSVPVYFKETIDNILTKEQHIPQLLIPGVNFALENIFGLAINKNFSGAIAQDTKTKSLILHAKNDQSVSLKNSQILKTFLPNSNLVVFPNGSHIETFKKNPELYRTVVFKFLEENFK